MLGLCANAIPALAQDEEEDEGDEHPVVAYEHVADSAFAAARNNQVAEAIACFSRAIKLDSNRVEAWYGLGYCKQMSCLNGGKECREAIYCYTRAIKINPKFRNSYFNRGLCKSLMKDHMGAISDYDEQLKITPEDAESYCNRGVDKILAGDKSGGCADLAKASGMGDSKAAELQLRFCRQ